MISGKSVDLNVCHPGIHVCLRLFPAYFRNGKKCYGVLQPGDPPLEEALQSRREPITGVIEVIKIRIVPGTLVFAGNNPLSGKVIVHPGPDFIWETHTLIDAVETGGNRTYIPPPAINIDFFDIHCRKISFYWHYPRAL